MTQDAATVVETPQLTVRAIVALMVVALICGGGGSPAPVTEFLVEIAALITLGAVVVAGVRPLDGLAHDRSLALLAATIVTFPLIQLLPLPPAAWQGLPGRQAARAGWVLAGAGADWHPWSLLPDATLAAWLSLLPAVAMLALATTLQPRGRVRLVTAVALLGLVAAILGVVQFVLGPDRPLSMYDDIHRGWGIGFFANRNAQADLIAIALTGAMLVAARHWADWPSATRLGCAAAAAVMLAGGVVTGSRMGMVVLCIPVTLALVSFGRHARIVALGGVLAAVVAIVGGTALDRVAARAQDPGNRVEIWGDSLFVARHVVPVGGGLGSFQPLYAAAERLDHVQPTIANRAHNDYLELAIEGGLPALGLLGWAVAFVGRRTLALWRDPDPDIRLLARFAGTTALVLLIHSTVDYPLRNLTLLTLAGLALAGVSRPRMTRDLRAGEVGVVVHA